MDHPNDFAVRYILHAPHGIAQLEEHQPRAISSPCCHGSAFGLERPSQLLATKGVLQVLWDGEAKLEAITPPDNVFHAPEVHAQNSRKSHWNIGLEHEVWPRVGGLATTLKSIGIF